MKITFDEIQKSAGAETRTANNAASMPVKPSLTAKELSVGGFSVDLSSKANAIGEYSRQKQDQESVLDQAKATDAEAVKNKMLICASTMSAEDYKEMVKDGVKPGKVEVGDAVTIMDHIKTVMAKSGTIVSGFNGEGDLDMDKLIEMTGSPAYAKQISEAFSANDLPLNEDNVKDVLSQKDRIEELTGITDGMKRYLLENNMEPTADHLYLAKYSAAENRPAGGGYFTEDLAGYIGRSSDTAGGEDWTQQIDRFLEEADFPLTEESRKMCEFLMDSQLLLTRENITALADLEKISLPMDPQDALLCMTEAIAEGKQAKDANLAHESLRQKATRIKETVDSISEAAVEKTITEGKSFTIRSLASVQRSLDAAISLNIQSEAAVNVAPGEESGAEKILSAQRVFAEVRLQMTVSANMQLLSSGFSIDTAELSDLVDSLKAAEVKAQERWNLTAPTQEADAIFAQSMAERKELFAMPAAVLGQIADGFEKITLHKTYEAGKQLQAVYQKAGESYEALMTAPRADLGDRIKDAFSNIDELLADANMESSEDNRRAVRILAYNKMELTTENITMVRAADQTVRSLLEKMNPAATLQMIREGINPLEHSIEELDAYFTAQELLPENQSEKFSSFLYQMEQTNGITEDERQTYMGIYRMLHQIEKGDGKAIGAVAGSGRQLTFANLLSAVRTSKKGGVDATVDDDFGGATGSVQKSISHQIEGYYQKKAQKVLAGLNPEWMKKNSINLATTLDELVDAQIIEDTKTAEELQKEEIESLRQALGVSERVVEMLQENGLSVTGDNLLAMQEIVSDRGGTFRTLKQLAKAMDEADKNAGFDAADESERSISSAIEEWLSEPLKNFSDAGSARESYAEFTRNVSEILLENMQENPLTSLDVKSLSLCSRRLSILGKMSEKQEYDLPAVIGGELTAVNVRFVKDKALQQGASIRISLSGDRNILAEFSVKGETLQGIIGVSDLILEDQIKGKMREFSEKFLAETGKESDIKVIQTQTTGQFGPRRASTEETESSPREMYQASKLLLETLRTL